MHPIHILDSWNTIDGMEFQGVLLEYPTPLTGLSNVRHLFKSLDLFVKSVFFFHGLTIISMLVFFLT
jgi:hypothetical protein